MRPTEKNTLLENLDYTWSEDSIRYINTASSSARQTFFYVQEVGYFVTSAPYFTERQNLNSFLLIYTISGKGRLKYLGNTYYLTAGTVMFIDCIEHHYYDCLQNQEWEFLWFHFNGISALGYYKEFMKNGFRILTSIDHFFMESKMRRILSLTQRKDVHSEIIISGLIVEILTQILIENENESLNLGVMPVFVKEAVKVISTHFRESLSLDMIAESVNISKYHLSREFKKYIGTSPNEYMILCRIGHAKDLLKYTELSTETIAFQSGFRNVSHFISLFKKHEGITPHQFRTEWK